ncbi:MAG: alpha/beta hydrolase [Pseudomonadota bacterium]|nr:alpha/beta hydrolase [Pseudomonadota bacterium]
MPKELELTGPVAKRPLDAWGTVAVELIGSQTRFVKGERWTHRIVEMGEGPPLFMYHGVGGHLETFARTLPALARDFHVIGVDALFHGFSSKEPWKEGVPTPPIQAEAYVDLLRALGYEKAIFEGESMGAAIGVEIAMRYPETLDRLILNGFGMVKTKKTDWLRQPNKGNLHDLSHKAITDPTSENIRNRLHWLVHDESTINDEIVQLRQRLYQVPEINAAMRRVFGIGGERPNFFSQSTYTEDDVRERWRTPTLVMFGEFNPMLGPDYGRYCADLIGAQFYEFKQVGHWPQWEAPEEFVAVVRSFLGV